MAEISEGVIDTLIDDLKGLEFDEIQNTLDNMVEMSVIYEDERIKVLEGIEDEKVKAPQVETEFEETIAPEDSDKALDELDNTEDDEDNQDLHVPASNSETQRDAADSTKKVAVVTHKDDGYYVESESGKNLGGPYDSKGQAEERLKEVEMFKHMTLDLKRYPEVPDELADEVEDRLIEGTITDEMIIALDNVIAHLPTSDTFDYVPEGIVNLYHGTVEAFMSAIEPEGIRPLSVGKGDYAEDLVWMSDNPDGAWHHANKKAKMMDSKPLMLEVAVDTSAIGLHKSILKGFFTVHEVVPFSMVTNVRTSSYQPMDDEVYGEEEVFDYHGRVIIVGDYVREVDPKGPPIVGEVKGINFHGKYIPQTQLEPAEYPELELLVEYEDGSSDSYGDSELLEVVDEDEFTHKNRKRR